MNIHIVHIPKTGGMTLFRALRQANVPVTRSHDPAAIAEQSPGTVLAVLLRHPVDRVVSLYRHQLRSGGFSGSMSDFLFHTPQYWWWGVENVQTEMLRQAERSQRPLRVTLTCNLNALLRPLCDSAVAKHNVAPPDDIVITSRDRDMIAMLNIDEMLLWERMPK